MRNHLNRMPVTNYVLSSIELSSSQLARDNSICGSATLFIKNCSSFETNTNSVNFYILLLHQRQVKPINSNLRLRLHFPFRGITLMVEMIDTMLGAVRDTRKAMTAAGPLLHMRAPQNGEKLAHMMYNEIYNLADAVVNARDAINKINRTKKPSVGKW